MWLWYIGRVLATPSYPVDVTKDDSENKASVSYGYFVKIYLLNVNITANHYFTAYL